MPRRLALAFACAAALLTGMRANAEDPAEEDASGEGRPDRSIMISGGLGFVASDASTTDALGGTGLLLDGAYAFRSSRWFSPRLHGGLLFTGSARAECSPAVQPCQVSANLGYVDARVRVRAPIPWVAPFLEVGLGAVLGRYRNQVGQERDGAGSGIGYAVPLSLGLALGERHQFELVVSYLVVPGWHLLAGGATVGFGFGL